MTAPDDRHVERPDVDRRLIAALTQLCQRVVIEPTTPSVTSLSTALRARVASRRRRQWAVIAAAVCLLASVVAATWWTSRDRSPVSVGNLAQIQRGGRPLPAPPAPFRSDRSVSLVGDRLILWGGKSTAELGPSYPTDGAVFDLRGWQWRSFPAAPVAPGSGAALPMYALGNEALIVGDGQLAVLNLETLTWTTVARADLDVVGPGVLYRGEVVFPQAGVAWTGGTSFRLTAKLSGTVQQVAANDRWMVAVHAAPEYADSEPSRWDGEQWTAIAATGIAQVGSMGLDGDTLELFESAPRAAVAVSLPDGSVRPTLIPPPAMNGCIARFLPTTIALATSDGCGSAVRRAEGWELLGDVRDGWLPPVADATWVIRNGVVYRAEDVEGWAGSPPGAVVFHGPLVLDPALRPTLTAATVGQDRGVILDADPSTSVSTSHDIVLVPQDRFTVATGCQLTVGVQWPAGQAPVTRLAALAATSRAPSSVLIGSEHENLELTCPSAAAYAQTLAGLYVNGEWSPVSVPRPNLLGLDFADLVRGPNRDETVAAIIEQLRRNNVAGEFDPTPRDGGIALVRWSPGWRRQIATAFVLTFSADGTTVTGVATRDICGPGGVGADGACQDPPAFGNE